LLKGGRLHAAKYDLDRWSCQVYSCQIRIGHLSLERSPSDWDSTDEIQLIACRYYLAIVVARPREKWGNGVWCIVPYEEDR
jgi:hypothetical protein